jgi:hypothetical protein
MSRIHVQRVRTQAQKDKIDSRILRDRVGQPQPVSTPRSKALKKEKGTRNGNKPYSPLKGFNNYE